MWSNFAKLSGSRLKSCTVAMPVMFSWRNALIRAMRPRTTRYDSRTLRRNHCVTSTMSGSTEKATSASRQFMPIMMIMIPASAKTSPKIVITPAVNRSLSASTSDVTRVISLPTGFLS